MREEPLEGEGEPGRVVPPRYMVALIATLQTSILGALAAQLPNQQAQVVRLGLAWNKMLIIQLEMFLKTLAPQFPEWDETVT